VTHLRGLRIGYVPYTDDLAYAGDRRRFCYYAHKRNIPFELAKPSESYDIVVVTERGDLSTWSTYNRGSAKIVYSLINRYLAVPWWDLKASLRGVAKFVTREARHLQLNYWRAMEAMCERADAVVCTTDEQRQDILPYCKNVHIILDIHTADVRAVKTDYGSGDTFHFGWEGLAENIEPFFAIRAVLARLQRKRHVALHLVTERQYGRFMRKYWRSDTARLAAKLPVPTYLYQWNPHTCSAIIAACDMALIPIALDNPVDAGKPENKLLLIWRMGVPAVVSATPAYSRTMRRADLPMACRTQEEWVDTLERYVGSEAARRDAGQRGRRFAEEHYSEARILADWDKLFASVLDGAH